MMQIRELILYGYNGKRRCLSFNLGEVNIITGESKTGKSVIGDIIEYCLGGYSCNIADGIVRDNVEWYGLLLQFEYERVFVARKNPDKGKQTSDKCYIETGEKIEVPEYSELSATLDVSAIEEILSRRIGISENLHVPPKGQTRQPIEANIRHALLYCFQDQDEIAAKNFLFHRQIENFMPQTIKDTLPYFLGAVDETAVFLRSEKDRINRILTLEKHKLEEKQKLIGEKSLRAVSLFKEAQQIGLIDESVQIEKQNFLQLYNILQQTINQNLNIAENHSSMKQVLILQDKIQKIRDELENIEIKLDNAKKFSEEALDYFGEVSYQKKRLESIGLFEQLNFDSGKCPLCSATLENPLPSVEMIKMSIFKLDESIKNVTKEDPKLIEYISSLENEREKKINNIKTLEAEIDGLYQQNNDFEQTKDVYIRKGKVMGRISFWLESVENDNEEKTQELKIKDLEKHIKEIDEKLDSDSIEEKKQSALSRIQEDMTQLAKLLNLEYSNNIYRLDLNKLTIVIEKPERSVPLKQLGSGSNWVGIHLITYFALQRFFIKRKRPVPRFLFLDQPSQVYFPSRRDKKDWKEVEKIYQFIIEQTKELDGNLQVIIVDHADFDTKEFKKVICEDWRQSGGKKLVPQDWYDNTKDN